MGSSIFGFIDKKNENNPQNVMIPPNLGGYNRVIISLPNGLTIDDILNDLVEAELLDGIEEYDKRENDHYIIKRPNESETDLLVKYLNNKFGYIAHKGYVKPSRNIVIDADKFGATTADIPRSTHIALVRSPDGKNPNEQFAAYRREYDPDTEFPKFERVDIEQIIHYTRPEDIAHNMANSNKLRSFQDPMADTENNGMDQALNAMNAMRQGQQFDVTETEVVKDREAVKIDYVEKVRKLRLALKSSKLRRFGKGRVQRSVCEQFKYDHMNNLIELKRKKYGIKRAKRIYEIQRKERLSMATLKQEIDPYFNESKYNKQQKQFWKDFDYSTK